MKSPVIRLLQKAFSNFNLFEFTLPVASIYIGLGIVSKASMMIDNFALFQMILYFAFLETGSQMFLFYKQEFFGSATKVEIRDERNAAILLIVLFFGISILPLSNILQGIRTNPSFLILLAISSFLIIVWRNIGELPIHQIISYFLFSLAHSFFIPLTQLVFYRVDTNTLFIVISQVFFLLLFGYLMIREIFRIEINLEQRRIVQIIGTIPLMRMAQVLFLLGIVIQVMFNVRKPEAELTVFSIISVGWLLLTLYQIIHLDHNGKPGIKFIYHATGILLITQYLGWLLYLWML